MRLSLLSLALAACANIAAAEDPDRENTYFNAKKVPPLLELTPDSFEKELKEAKWMMVKHYSPYCPHCQDYAPTFQTLYEFYYTQDPGRSGAEDDFYRTYDFKFASINCVAYFDLCSKNGVQSYPTTILYHNGEVVESMRGVQNMSVLSDVVESSLEKERPGSRPKPHEFLLPEPGDKASPTGTVKEEVKEAGVKVPIPDAGKVEAAKEAPIDKTVQELAKTTSTTAKTQETAVGAKSKAGKVSATRPTWPIPTIIIPKPESTGTPNANGMSVELNAESFQNLVTLTQDPWFVKFYAPWCHHCQALAPTWEQLAKEMKGKLNIGEVNCDKEKRLCKDANVRGFPTLQFFKGGEHVEYQGLRGLGDLIKYTEKAVDAIQGVQDVDLAAFEELEQKEEVIFVYFYDHAVVTEDFMALEKLPLNLIGRAKLVRTSDPAMYDRFKITTWPRLVVSREGRPSYYQPLTPRAMRDVNQILEWMKSVWLPIVPELTATNSREIMDGKIVVLGILNREDKDSFQRAIKEMKSASSEWMDKQIQLFQLERQELRDTKQLRIEEAEDRGDSHALRQAKSIRIKMDMSDQKQVTFAWVDGVFWQRWVRSTYGIDVTDGERVIINDEDNKRYWDTTITGNYIIPSRTSILETINKVVASPPKIKPKLTINSIERIVFDIRVAFIEHPYLTGGCITGFALSALIWYRGRMRRARGGYFRVDESHGVKDLKDGLLGGASTNGKVD